jgi:hypothetical protein
MDISITGFNTSGGEATCAWRLCRRNYILCRNVPSDYPYAGVIAPPHATAYSGSSFPFHPEPVNFDGRRGVRQDGRIASAPLALQSKSDRRLQVSQHNTQIELAELTINSPQPMLKLAVNIGIESGGKRGICE